MSACVYTCLIGKHNQRGRWVSQATTYKVSKAVWQSAMWVSVQLSYRSTVRQVWLDPLSPQQVLLLGEQRHQARGSTHLCRHSSAPSREREREGGGVLSLAATTFCRSLHQANWFDSVHREPYESSCFELAPSIPFFDPHWLRQAVKVSVSSRVATCPIKHGIVPYLRINNVASRIHSIRDAVCSVFSRVPTAPTRSWSIFLTCCLL